MSADEKGLAKRSIETQPTPLEFSRPPARHIRNKFLDASIEADVASNRRHRAPKVPSFNEREKDMAEVITETTSEVEELTGEDFEVLFGETPLIITDSEVRN
ncbi:hypothetical protein GCM10022295_61160 [Streptomyces osmaniensis]|uniref:Uncharacterized protein n=1 Tax=Streptomyces osmaniensis TaxID=593134 RepID=A0ABP6XT56_9ACTN